MASAAFSSWACSRGCPREVGTEQLLGERRGNSSDWLLLYAATEESESAILRPESC